MRLVILLLAVLTLAGCGLAESERQQYEAKIAELSAANRQAQAELDQQRQWERAASIATACDALVPVCPASMTKVGRAALAAGIQPSGWPMWVVLLVKALALAAILGAGAGACWTLARWGHIVLTAPSREEAEAARQAIREAEARQQKAEYAAMVAEQRLRAAQEQASQAEARAAEAEAKAEKAEKQAEAAKAAAAALRHF